MKKLFILASVLLMNPEFAWAQSVCEDGVCLNTDKEEFAPLVNLALQGGVAYESGTAGAQAGVNLHLSSRAVTGQIIIQGGHPALTIQGDANIYPVSLKSSVIDANVYYGNVMLYSVEVVPLTIEGKAALNKLGSVGDQKQQDIKNAFIEVAPAVAIQFMNLRPRDLLYNGVPVITLRLEVAPYLGQAKDGDGKATTGGGKFGLSGEMTIHLGRAHLLEIGAAYKLGVDVLGGINNNLTHSADVGVKFVSPKTTGGQQFFVGVEGIYDQRDVLKQDSPNLYNGVGAYAGATAGIRM